MSDSLEHQQMTGCAIISGKDMQLFPAYLKELQKYPNLNFHEWKTMKWEGMVRTVKANAK